MQEMLEQSHGVLPRGLSPLDEAAGRARRGVALTQAVDAVDPRHSLQHAVRLVSRGPQLPCSDHRGQDTGSAIVGSTGRPASWGHPRRQAASGTAALGALATVQPQLKASTPRPILWRSISAR